MLQPPAPIAVAPVSPVTFTAFDAAGEHDEAINQLALATQEGDLDAMVRLVYCCGLPPSHVPRGPAIGAVRHPHK